MLLLSGVKIKAEIACTYKVTCSEMQNVEFMFTKNQDDPSEVLKKGAFHQYIIQGRSGCTVAFSLVFRAVGSNLNSAI